MGLLSLDLEMMTTGIDYKDGDDSYASSSNEEDYAFYYNTPRQYVSTCITKLGCKEWCLAAVGFFLIAN